MVGYEIQYNVIGLSNDISNYITKLVNREQHGIFRSKTKHESVYLTTFVDYLKVHDLDRPTLNRVDNEQLKNMLVLTNTIINTDYNFNF